VQIGDRHPSRARDRALLLAPGRHAAVQVAGDPGHADRARERGGAAPVGVVAADEHDVLARIGEPGELGAEAGAQRGDADRSGDVRVVELQLGAYVDQQRTLGTPALELARRERVRSAVSCRSGPAVDLDDVAEVRRLWPERGERGADERVLVGDRERRVVRALETDRGGDLEVHPGTAAHRAAEMPGPQLDLARQGEQLCMQRPEDPARALLAVHCKIGPRHVADEQAVARQDRPGRIVAACGVVQQEGRVLGTVAGV
jgi:hypothetical protein